MREISFGELVNSSDDLDSIRESEFFKHFCNKEVLHFTQDDRTRFEHLLSWGKINEILSLNLLDRQRLRITRDGRDVPPAFYRVEGPRDHVSASKLRDLIKQNASIVMNRVQDLSPPVRRMALQIENAIDQKLNVNGYMTFGGGGAFAMHYDPHDVLVMQVYGTKHWFIYDEPEPSPTDHEKNRAKKPAPRNVVFETILQPGDALYVPRGTYHRAEVTDTDSVHLTFGIHTAKGLDFLETLRSKFQDEELIRRDIPSLLGPEAVAERERELKSRLCEIINNASLSDFLNDFRKSRGPVDEFRLGPSAELNDETVVAPLLRYPDAWRESVETKGSAPSDAAKLILDLLMKKRMASVAELKSELDGGLDQDTVDSTIAQLVNDCWVEVVR